MADEVEQAVVTTEGNAQNEEAAVGRLTQFPQTRVRNMMKIDPDLHLANRESVFLLTKAAVSLNIITAFFLISINKIRSKALRAFYTISAPPILLMKSFFFLSRSENYS